MNIIFAGGGTAGHINPSLAVAKRLSQNDKIRFISREGGTENALIEKEGFALSTVKVSGLSGGIVNACRALSRLPHASRQVEDIFDEFSPDLVFATGGYVSYPVLRVAIKRGIPTVLHESNVRAGLVTRLLAGRVSRLLLPDESLDKKLALQKNALRCPTPIKREFFEIGYAEARRRLGICSAERLIVSFGGSLGAEKLNSAVISLISEYSRKRSRIRHIHGVGERFFEKIKKSDASLTQGVGGCFVVPYIYDMPLYLNAADLVICRAGASTVAELSACRVPSILVPSPNVKDDHQTKNALSHARSNPCKVITEGELSVESLRLAAEELLNDNSLRKSIINLRNSPRTSGDGGQKIVDIIRELV